eukprot:4186652-Pleurochrysis_carterae.AAC.1
MSCRIGCSPLLLDEIDSAVSACTTQPMDAAALRPRRWFCAGTNAASPSHLQHGLRVEGMRGAVCRQVERAQVDRVGCDVCDERRQQQRSAHACAQRVARVPAGRGGDGQLVREEADAAKQGVDVARGGGRLRV